MSGWVRHLAMCSNSFGLVQCLEEGDWEFCKNILFFQINKEQDASAFCQADGSDFMLARDSELKGRLQAVEEKKTGEGVDWVLIVSVISNWHYPRELEEWMRNSMPWKQRRHLQSLHSYLESGFRDKTHKLMICGGPFNWP